MKAARAAALTALVLWLTPAAGQGPDVFEAIRQGDVAAVKGLVDANPQLVKARNANQSTPLHVAADADSEPIARYLIEKGADVHAVNRNRWTPLFYARTAGMARLLVDNGADINVEMPLAWMWATKRREVAEYLMEKGAVLPGCGTPQGRLFLVRSLRAGSGAVLARCLGFPLSYESPASNSLLHYASEGDSPELIDTLIGRGVPADKANMFGWTPLHVAAANGNLQVVKALLKKAVDVNSRTPDGHTPFTLAVEAHKSDTAEYLKSIGADQRPQRFPELRGEYLGQPKPGGTAVPFAPGILTPRHEYHGAIAWTPDGNEMYWSAYVDETGASILRAVRVNGAWQKPELFCQGDVPFIAPDGKRLYYVAWKPGRGERREVIFVRNRTASGWSEAKEVADLVNAAPGIHWQVSVDRQGNLYFGASGENGSRIYNSTLLGGEYGQPRVVEHLKEVEAFSPYIAADGSYLIFTTVEEGENLVITFRKEDGTWTKGIDLSSHIGTGGAFCPIVTPDGRYLFCVRGVDGKYANYWVGTSFIEKLRRRALQEK
jgi:ankyrin repeat protein